jgi:hypothetical protein
MKPSFYFSIVSATIVILSLQVAQVDAAPTHRQSFEQWCLQKDSLPVETKKTIEALLNNAGTQDCKLADMKLNSLSKLYLSGLSGAENSGESQDETMVIRANSIRKSNFSRLAIEAQAGGGLVLGKICKRGRGFCW